MNRKYIKFNNANFNPFNISLYKNKYCLYILHIENNIYKFGITKDIYNRWKAHNRDFAKYKTTISIVKLFNCKDEKIMRDCENKIKSLAKIHNILIKKYNKTEIICTNDIDIIINMITKYINIRNKNINFRANNPIRNKSVSIISKNINIEICSDKYNDLILVDDITKNQYEELICKTLTDAEKIILYKFLLRKTFNYNNVIDMEFLKIYGNKKAMNIYKNLYDITRNNALENIKKDNEYLSKNYLQHKYAIELLTIAGFDSILDTKNIIRDDLLKNILVKKEEIITNMKNICITFDDKRPLIKWEFKNILEFINGILFSMYGFRINETKSHSKNYKINHKYLYSLFDNKINDNKPYINI